MHVESFVLLIATLLVVGALLMWKHGERLYNKGITDAVLMHREGRLTYHDYYDDSGDRMVDIHIDPEEEE
jgi:hypothetical protein